MTKKEIRKFMLDKRNNLKRKEHGIKNDSIINKIRNDENYIKSENIAIFFPFNKEINLIPLTKDNKNFYIPKVEGKEMHFYKLDEKTKLVRSKFGILEPTSGDISDHKIDFMIVPALAISKERYRIGYGGGYYDKFIGKNNLKHKVGVIFDFQEVENIPIEHFDQQLDYYIKD